MNSYNWNIVPLPPSPYTEIDSSPDGGRGWNRDWPVPGNSKDEHRHHDLHAARGDGET